MRHVVTGPRAPGPNHAPLGALPLAFTHSRRRTVDRAAALGTCHPHRCRAAGRGRLRAFLRRPASDGRRQPHPSRAHLRLPTRHRRVHRHRDRLPARPTDRALVRPSLRLGTGRHRHRHQHLGQRPARHPPQPAEPAQRTRSRRPHRRGHLRHRPARPGRSRPPLPPRPTPTHANEARPRTAQRRSHLSRRRVAPTPAPVPDADVARPLRCPCLSPPSHVANVAADRAPPSSRQWRSDVRPPRDVAAKSLAATSRRPSTPRDSASGGPAWTRSRTSSRPSSTKPEPRRRPAPSR